MGTTNKDMLHTTQQLPAQGGSKMRGISRSELKEMQSMHGSAFNKTLVESQLNRSSSKASYGFTKAKRFSHVSVNEDGFAITMLAGPAGSRNKALVSSITKASTSSPSKRHFQMPTNSSLPRNLKKVSGSVKHESIQSPDEQHDEEDNYEYDEEMQELMSEANQTGGLGKVGSIEQLNGRNTDLLRVGNASSMAGSAIRRNARAQSMIYHQSTFTQGSAAPFGSSGPRFAASPKQLRPREGNPSPTSYDIRPNHFKNQLEQGRGSSFGLGRSQMQKTDQERDILNLKKNPSPVNYEPVHVGKVMAQDAIKYSFSSKAHPVDFVEKNKNKDKQGPGKYVERHQLDYFANDIRYNNKLTNPKTSTFGQEKRFSFPTCEPRKAPPATKYTTRSYWQMDAKESIFRNSGAAIFNRNRTDILKEKYHLKERSQFPAPGTYNSQFSEFSGGQPLPKPQQSPLKIHPTPAMAQTQLH